MATHIADNKQSKPRRGSLTVTALVAIFCVAVPAGLYWYLATDRSMAQASAIVSSVFFALGAGLIALQTLYPLANSGRRQIRHR